MAQHFSPPKGTRDFLPEEMALRQYVFTQLRKAFELFGFQEIDTPAFEYLEVLTLKSGPQAEQEIYAFEDKNGRKLGLRFDLTAPTGRVMASHPELKRPVYRYQIGKVWRYDRPAAGRYREFYQADVDIIGSSSLDCEMELLQLGLFVLQILGLKDAVFIINHRKLLEAQLRFWKFPPTQWATALRILDKRDKISVQAMLDEATGAGLDAHQYQQFLNQLEALSSNKTLEAAAILSNLRSNFADDLIGQQAVDELIYLFNQARSLGLTQQLKLDLYLARGLDYYTGTVIEAKATIGDQLLSFAGGGRYDDLIPLYGGQDKAAVGFSFGVERLIETLRQIGHLKDWTAPAPVLIIPIGNASAAQQLAVKLRTANIATKVSLKTTSVGKQLQQAESLGYPWVICVGQTEADSQRYPLRDMAKREEKILALPELIKHLTHYQMRGSKLVSN